MSDDSNKINISGLEDWKRGDQLEARKFQQPVNALKAMAGIRPGQQEISFGNTFEVRQFKVIKVEQDYFTAFTWDGHDKGEIEVKIALPYMLRKTPFTGEDEDGEEKKREIELTGVSLTYEYEDNFIQRLATATTIDDEGAESESEEHQTIIPSYEEDDVVVAMRGVTGGVGVQDAEEKQLIWQDMNVDARFWMNDNDPPEEEESA